MSSIREKVRGLLGTSASTTDAESAAEKKKKEEEEAKKKKESGLDAGKVKAFQAGFRGVK